MDISKPIQRLYNKRFTTHNDILLEMEVYFKEINTNIEYCIKTEGEKLKQFLNKLKKEVDDNIKALKDGYSDQKAENFIKVVLKINHLRTLKIQEYILYLIKLENERSNQYKLKYRETFMKLMDVAHLLPCELKLYFENKLTHFNHITLNNFRCYYDLEHTLNIQIDSDFILWVKEIKMIQMDINEQKLLKEKPIEEPKRSTKEILIDDVLRLIHEMKFEVASIEISCRKLVKIAKILIMNICNDNLKEQDKVFEENFENKQEVARITIAIDCEIDFEEFTEEEINDLLKSYEENINENLKNLKYYQDLFEYSGKLWTNHFNRILLIESLVEQDLKNTLKKNNLRDKVFQTKLSVALDKLRQESSGKQVEVAFQKVKTFFHQLKSKYENNFLIEKKVIEKYRTFMQAEADVLLKEIEFFLKINPPSHEYTKKFIDSQMDLFSASSFTFSIDSKTPTFIIYAGLYVEALNNWKLGMEQGLKTYMEKYKKNLNEQINEWINKKENELKVKLDFLLKCNEEKLNIIYVSFYKTRLKELGDHENVLKQYKIMVNEEVSLLKLLLKTTIEDLNNNAMQICQQISFSDVKNYGHLRQIKNNLNRKWENLKQANNLLLLEFKDKFKNCSMRVNFTTVKILKSIRLFAENGNFGNVELSTFLKNLSKIEQTVEKSFIDSEKQIALIAISVKETLEQELDNFTLKCLQVEKEVKFNETVTRLKKNFTNNISNETKEFNNKIELIYTNLVQFENIYNKNTEIEVFMKNFQQNLKETTTTLKQLTNNLKSNYLNKSEQILFDFNQQLKSVHQQNNIDFNEIQQMDNFQLEIDGNIQQLVENLRCGRLHVWKNCFSIIDQYYDNVENDFIQFTQEKINDFGEILNETESLYKNLHKKLKTMFGHPKNNEFLKQLENEMINLEETSNNHLKASKEINRNLIKEQHKNIIKQQQNVEDFVNLLPSFDYFENLELVNDEILSEINITKLLYEIIEKALKKSTQQALNGIYDHYSIEISTKESEINELHDRYRKMWHFDVNTILKFYSVKYDHIKQHPL